MIFELYRWLNHTIQHIFAKNIKLIYSNCMAQAKAKKKRSYVISYAFNVAVNTIMMIRSEFQQSQRKMFKLSIKGDYKRLRAVNRKILIKSIIRPTFVN